VARTPAAVFGRTIGAILLGAAVLVSTATTRAYLNGKRHYAEAMRLSSEGDTEKAVPSFEDAVRAYFPGSPYPEKAIRELEILAKAAEMRGDAARAWTVLEATRRAILSTRHVTQPYEQQLKKTENAIRRVQTRQKGAFAGSLENLTARPIDPSPLFSVILVLGLLGWSGGALALCLGIGGVPPKGRTAAMVMCLGGFLVWLCATWLAG
jgi:hypothetical protein